MAALVEDARWRTSARGRRYMLATMSDQSGQFMASCFDDGVGDDIEQASRNGGCGLLTVELDWRPGEDTPRVAVKRIQPFEAMTNSTRLLMELVVSSPAALPAVARLLENIRGGRGEVLVSAGLPDGGTARLRLGRDFLLDAELVARIEQLPGVDHVELTSPLLKLVG